MKYFIDSKGRYIGGFDGVEPPVGSVEVDAPPTHGSQVWDGESWSEYRPVPQVVSRFQARAALYKANMLESAELAVSNSDPLTKLAWADAQEFRRDSPILQSIAQALGLTSDDLDALFVSASEIVV